MKVHSSKKKKLFVISNFNIINMKNIKCLYKSEMMKVKSNQCKTDNKKKN